MTRAARRPDRHSRPGGRARSDVISEADLEGSVVDRFARVAARFPERLAVQDDVSALTYGELRDKVDRIAAAVAAAVQGREGPVAVLARHDVGFPAAFLGAMAAGRPVVLLDGAHPAERNRRIAEQSGACAAVVAEQLQAHAREIFPADAPFIDLDAPGAPEAAPRGPGPGDLAYVLYTSGSTGAPKGVVHDHRTALHDTLLFTEFAQVRPEDRLVIFYSGVIASTRRTLGALLNGASLHILSPERLGAAGMLHEVTSRRISVLVDVPTVFRRMIEALPAGERLPSLQFVCLSGDRCDWSDYDAFARAAAEGAVFAISAGSTEVSSGYARWVVDPAARSAGGRLPVGRPLRDLRLWIEGPDGEALPDGEAGELVVSSRFLARGYWRDAAATAASFEPDPADPSAQRFRTGDIGLRRPDGLFELIARRDRQIKLGGQRVEPAEMEAALRGFAGVADAGAVVRRDETGAARAMVAYVELQADHDTLLPRHLMAMASRALPGRLGPSAIFILPALPRLMNLKLDRLALERLDAARAQNQDERAADPLLDRVARVFESIVPGARATPEDNLLSLGGDSLQAVELALELERALGLAVPQAALRRSGSIRELAGWISRRLPPQTPTPPA